MLTSAMGERWQPNSRRVELALSFKGYVAAVYREEAC